MNPSVLVTGSSRGIGRAIALACADDGYDVVVHCRSRREQADEVAAAIVARGRAARVLQFDVTDRAACEAALAADMAEHGARNLTPTSRARCWASTLTFDPTIALPSKHTQWLHKSK